MGSPQKVCPTMLDYKIMADADSMYNTPPCWSMYVCGLVFKKLLAEGGLPAMQERNEAKVRAPACRPTPRPRSHIALPPMRILCHCERCPFWVQGGLWCTLQLYHSSALAQSPGLHPPWRFCPPQRDFTV